MDYNIEKLMQLFENNNDITFILSRDLAFDLVEELEMKGHRFCEDYSLKDVKELYDSNALMVSRNESFGKEECFFEVAYGNRHLKYVDTYQLAIIEEGVVEDWEIKEYVMGGYVLFTYEDDCEEIDEDEMFIEDCVYDFCEGIIKVELENNECFHCYVKEFMEEIYETAYNQAVKDIADVLCL